MKIDWTKLQERFENAVSLAIIGAVIWVLVTTLTTSISIKNLDLKVDNLETRISARMDNLESKMDTRFDKLDARLDKALSH